MEAVDGSQLEVVGGKAWQRQWNEWMMEGNAVWRYAVLPLHCWDDTGLEWLSDDGMDCANME